MDEDKPTAKDEPPSSRKDESRSRIQFDVETGRGNPGFSETGLGDPIQRTYTDGLSIRSINTARSPQLAVEYRTLSIKLDEDDIKQEEKFKTQADEIAEELKEVQWHTIHLQSLYGRLSTSPTTGLSSEQIPALLAEFGPNTPTPPPSRIFHKILVYCFGGFGTLLLVGGILVMIAWKPLGKPPAPANLALGVVLLLVFLIQAAFNAWQDWSSVKVMQSIKTMLPEECTVVRDGERKRVQRGNLVRGDVVCIALGDRVPADLRMCSTTLDCKFDRSILTGESNPVTATVDSTDLNYLETRCIALQGTHCVAGSGIGIVVDTGDMTVFGRIAKLSSKPRKGLTPLQREILRFVLVIVSLVVLFVILVIILWAVWIRKSHPNWIDVSLLIVNCVSVAIAFIPEGLPIALTTCLTITAYQMKKNNILCKSLATVETLGSVSLLCSDKTGTLTKNKMFVTDFCVGDERYNVSHNGPPTAALDQVHFVAALCNAAQFDAQTGHLPLDQRKLIGDATDQSILRFAESIKPVSTMQKECKRVFEIPFNSKNKYMLSLIEHVDEKEYVLMMKGAPDILLPQCSSVLLSDSTQVPLDPRRTESILQTQIAWALEGKRVLLLSCKPIAKSHFRSAPYTAAFGDEVLAAADGMCVVSLVGIVDPPREEIPGVIATLRNAGIKIFMVTGDFKLTAQAIGRACGILTVPQRLVDDFTALDRRSDTEVDNSDAAPPKLPSVKGAIVLEGSELISLDDAQWNQLAQYKEIIFARTTPEQKLRIVKEFQKRDIVAMTGDGVNDAPSLKAADVGIALASGSDVAIEAADMVLMDSFVGIVGAVRSGRAVFDNLRKTITYLLPAGSFSELWPIMFNVIFGLPQVLSSFLMIVICCFTDCFAAMTLAYEPPESDVLTRPPRNIKSQHLVDAKLLGHAYFFIGAIECACSMAMAFWYMERKGLPFSAIWLRFGAPDERLYDSDWVIQTVNEGSSVYFVTLVVMQFFNLLSTRTRRLSMFHLPPTKNWRLFPAMVAAVVTVFIFCYIPFFQKLIGSTPVTVEHWFLPAAFGAGLLLLDEARKWAVREWPNGFLAKIAW